MAYRPFCIKGKKISNFLIQSEFRAYPMEDTKYLAILPLWKESYIEIQKTSKGLYKLLKFVFIYGNNI